MAVSKVVDTKLLSVFARFWVSLSVALVFFLSSTYEAVFEVAKLLLQVVKPVVVVFPCFWHSFKSFLDHRWDFHVVGN